MRTLPLALVLSTAWLVAGCSYHKHDHHDHGPRPVERYRVEEHRSHHDYGRYRHGGGHPGPTHRHDDRGDRYRG